MFDLLNQSKNNITAATANLLRLLKVKVTISTIEDTLLSHPDYPSMLSIADALRSWGETLVLRTNYDKLSSLPLSSIAHLKTLIKVIFIPFASSESPPVYHSHLIIKTN